MSLRKPAVYAARRLRREMTFPEVLLWQAMRTRPGGFKFRRQHPIGPYVVDSFCREAALVVEIDGSAHDGPERSSRDALREAELRKKGLTVLRIAAAEVLRGVPSVVEGIIERARPPLHRLSPVPLPASGEE